MTKGTFYEISPAREKLTSLASKEEEKSKQKPTAGVGRKKGGDPTLKR